MPQSLILGAVWRSESVVAPDYHTYIAPSTSALVASLTTPHHTSAQR